MGPARQPGCASALLFDLVVWQPNDACCVLGWVPGPWFLLSGSSDCLHHGQLQCRREEDGTVQNDMGRTGTVCRGLQLGWAFNPRRISERTGVA